jgi:hypothetical protein
MQDTNQPKCTKPNCDCAEKEMIKQGTECIKDYPCLNADTSANELKSEFKKPSNWIEPGGTVA